MFYSRKSPRALFHDYSGGAYFVTICTLDKECFFGYISDDCMHLSAIGEYCRQQLEELSDHYRYAEVPLFVVMPNHIHAIIVIKDRNCSSVPAMRTALSVVIGGLKRSVTMYARRNGIDFGWQSRYHDHIIRNSRDGNNISDYIENNVVRWVADCFHQPK